MSETGTFTSSSFQSIVGAVYPLHSRRGRATAGGRFGEATRPRSLLGSAATPGERAGPSLGPAASFERITSASEATSTLGSQDREVHGISRHIGVAGRAAGLEGDVQSSEIRDEVPHSRPRRAPARRGRRGPHPAPTTSTRARACRRARRGRGLESPLVDSSRRRMNRHHVDVDRHVRRSVDRPPRSRR